MSQLSEKETLLMTAMLKHSGISIISSVDWDQVALETNYKDARNAKAMGNRLVKKLTGASTAAAPTAAADGDNDNAGEGSSKTGATAAGKKRKATGTPQGDASSSKAGRRTKKAKVTGPQFEAVNKDSATEEKTEDHASDAETIDLAEEEAAAVSKA